ncbi:MAG TPA: hydroxylamine reductase [Spirochaetota bacterium]|nr:hydroxylamine reductase [Spirochaetota bacterium]
MFCHQCQETAQNKGCDKMQGVCGKKSDVANLQDLFIWTLKGISFWGDMATQKNLYNEEAAFFIAKGLFMTITNADFSKDHFVQKINQAIKHRETVKKQLLEKTEVSGDLPDYAVWTPANDNDILSKAESGTGGWLEIENEDIRSLKATILYGLKGMSAYAEHGYQIIKGGEEIFKYIMEALSVIADENATQDDLISYVMKTGEYGVKAMAYLDDANSHYGDTEISEVNLGVGTNPGILISGHDLVDLEELLEQTKDQQVDIYTHSEMLPAHYRPFFKKYDHLRGNYGNSWYLQKDELKSFNGPALFTSNCLVPPDADKMDKIFTTGAVGFEGLAYIPDRKPGDHKDFGPIIEMAKKCDAPVAIESGKIVGGFGHKQVLKLADKIIDAIKAGKIKRFIVMAGCDGRHKSRSYYTEVAKELPKDTVILTAGCAKYRYNKLDLGDIDGIPRVLDAGQCNDSYSLAVIALELQKAFKMADINDLPISFDIAWYEQKAVLVLLALLHLGVKGIRLGPTLPGFLSPNIADFIIKSFELKGITNAKDDVQAMMAGK